MEQIYTPIQDYKVLVNCMTYNQSKYIEDALNGFAMQKTNFSFVCLVMDDCSIDGEQDVIKAWMERECDMSNAEYAEIEKSYITIVPHKSNKQCTFAFYFLKQNMYKEKAQKLEMVNPWRQHCEYEALCEGDDYWIDTLKLQHQCSFLDTHSDYSMCFHKAVILDYIGKGTSLKTYLVEDRDYNPTELFENWIVPTDSLFYRIESLNYRMVNGSDILNGDIVIVEKCAHTGKVRGMNTILSAYRVQPVGVTYDSKANLKRRLRYPDHYLCMKKNFPQISIESINRKLSEAYLGRMRCQDSIKGKIADLISSFRYSAKVPFTILLRKMINS